MTKPLIWTGNLRARNTVTNRTVPVTLDTQVAAPEGIYCISEYLPDARNTAYFDSFDADGTHPAPECPWIIEQADEGADTTANGGAPVDVAGLREGRFYIDCEFDGHGGALLSFGIVRGDGRGLHIRTTEQARDPWVIENVVPLLEMHQADERALLPLNHVGAALRHFIGQRERPVIIADSPVDIGRFCAAISTGDDGGWASADYPGMTFEVHNVDCYPTDLSGAVQHNAWWDAMALRHRLAQLSPDPRDALIAEMREALEALLTAAEGLARGVDWNNGTHAKKFGYREKLLSAIPVALATLTRAKEQE